MLRDALDKRRKRRQSRQATTKNGHGGRGAVWNLSSPTNVNRTHEAGIESSTAEIDAMSDFAGEPPVNPPSCISVVVCNEIIEDVRTHNKTLVSLFNSIVVQKSPAVHHRMFVMASLTDGRGTWPVSFVIRAPGGAELMRFDAEAAFPDPVTVVDISVEIIGLALPELGVYFVEVVTGTYPLGSRRFTVFPAQAENR